MNLWRFQIPKGCYIRLNNWNEGRNITYSLSALYHIKLLTVHLEGDVIVVEESTTVQVLIEEVLDLSWFLALNKFSLWNQEML